MAIEQIGSNQAEHLLQAGHVPATIDRIHKFLSLHAELIEAEFCQGETRLSERNTGFQA